MEEKTTREWVDIMEAIVPREGMHSYQGHYFDTAVSNTIGCNLV